MVGETMNSATSKKSPGVSISVKVRLEANRMGIFHFDRNVIETFQAC
jgi:hypothetical protein